MREAAALSWSQPLLQVLPRLGAQREGLACCQEEQPASVGAVLKKL